MCHFSHRFSGFVAASAILGLVAFSTDCASRATDPDIVGYMSQGFSGYAQYWFARPVQDHQISLAQSPV